MAKKAVVIGAGIGGLGASIRLARLGYDVTVIESNHHTGGKMNNLQLGKYRFDMGPSVFTGPEYIKELYELCGEDFSLFRYSKLHESFRYFYADGQRFTLPANLDEAIETLHRELGESKDALRTYLKKSEKNYKLIGPLFIEKSLHRFKGLLGKQLLKALAHLRSYRLSSTMHEENRATFNNPKTVQLFNRYATYNGSDPYKAPAMLNMIQHLEINEGVFLPEGGMVNIARNLQLLAEKQGVRFQFGETATKIIHNGQVVSGVATSTQVYDADIVMSNMDVSLTYERLLPDIEPPKKTLAQEKSSSALVFYWGISKNFPELGVHNIFFSSDYAVEFAALFDRLELPENPTVYINITSKVCLQDAPENGENWFVMINVPRNNGQDWLSYKEKARKTIISMINKTLNTSIESHIEEEFVMDPVYIETTYSGKFGSIYGNSSNNRYAAFYRHPNFSKQLKGLYFAGVSVHPGGGIPLALNSAKIAVQCLKEDYSL